MKLFEKKQKKAGAKAKRGLTPIQARIKIQQEVKIRTKNN